MAINVFSRYIWLADTINRAGRISFEEINKKWQRTDMIINHFGTIKLSVWKLSLFA